MSNEDPNIWREVFGPLAQVIAFFGGLGALVTALVTKKSWLETLRIVAVGVIVAFGLGTTSPFILAKVMPELAAVGGAVLGVFTTSGFIVGLVAVALVERFLSRIAREDKNDKAD